MSESKRGRRSSSCDQHKHRIKAARATERGQQTKPAALIWQPGQEQPVVGLEAARNQALVPGPSASKPVAVAAESWHVMIDARSRSKLIDSGLNLTCMGPEGWLGY